MEEYEIEKSPSIFATPNHGVHYSVNVSQVFGSPHSFDEVIHLLTVATPEDIINFNINSNGGDFYSLVALRNAIRQTEAQVYMNLLGMCASAGSALFLENADGYKIHEDSCMMIHSMQCGTGYTDANTIATRAEHNKKINERFVRNTYKDFLTEDEIEGVLNSKEIYLEDFEIRERLEKREQIKAQRQSQDENDFLESLTSENIDDIVKELSDDELQDELDGLADVIKELKKEQSKRKKGDKGHK